MDGTLIDSDQVSNYVWNDWANKNNISFDSILKVHHGRRPEETISLVAPELSIKDHSSDIYQAHATIKTGFSLIPGSKEFFNSLPLNSAGVVTSASIKVVENRFSCTGLRLDRVMVTSDIVKRGKPDPEPYLLAAELLKVSPKDCLVFEDAPAGIESAKSAGMRVVGVISTHTKEDLSRADYLIYNYLDLKYKIIDSMIFLNF